MFNVLVEILVRLQKTNSDGCTERALINFYIFIVFKANTYMRSKAESIQNALKSLSNVEYSSNFVEHEIVLVGMI